MQRHVLAEAKPRVDLTPGNYGVADLAEEEGHHPDFCVHYNRVEFQIRTHTINGLSENDFILAAKISRLAG